MSNQAPPNPTNPQLDPPAAGGDAAEPSSDAEAAEKTDANSCRKWLVNPANRWAVALAIITFIATLLAAILGPVLNQKFKEEKPQIVGSPCTQVSECESRFCDKSNGNGICGCRNSENCDFGPPGRVCDMDTKQCVELVEPPTPFTPTESSAAITPAPTLATTKDPIVTPTKSPVVPPVVGIILNNGSESAHAIDIPVNGACEDGNSIQLWYYRGSVNQKWKYHTATGLIESDICPGSVLHIKDGGNGCKPGMDIILYQDGGVLWERWEYSQDDKKIYSKYCKDFVIEIGGDEVVVGANIQLGNDAGSNAWNQKWELVPPTQTSAPTKKPTVMPTKSPVVPPVVGIINDGSESDHAIDIPGNGGCADGNSIQLWYHRGSDNQKWKYHTATGLIESVICRGSVLHIKDGGNGCKPGMDIILYQDGGVLWERWEYSQDDKKIYSKYCKDFVIEIGGDEVIAGANIQLGNDSGSNAWNQKWELVQEQ